MIQTRIIELGKILLDFKGKFGVGVIPYEAQCKISSIERMIKVNRQILDRL